MALAGSTGGALWHRSRHVHVPLHQTAVAVTGDGTRVALGAPGSPGPVPGTRALDAVAAAEQRAWLAAGTVPGGDGPHGAMVRMALLDLHVLTLADGAATAGWSPLWRHVWPRDAAFTAAAFAATGHHGDAAAVLGFLDRVQRDDGLFEARYRPDGSGPPDGRGIELDGTGWALWGAWQVVRATPDGASRGALARRLAGLVQRSSAAARRLVATRSGLPPASLDYWEVAEDEVTLGTAAPLLAGLEAAVHLHGELGQVPEAAACRSARDRLAAAIRDRFGARGYPRHVSGQDLDAAAAFLLPPFTTAPSALDPPGVARAWSRAQVTMARPAGGLAPGAGWKDDGISWTPETALFALSAAANGRQAEAVRWLDWLDRHRTVEGSLPEKVLSDGSPAAVAPLAWTAATVVLAAAALEDGRAAG